jgi:hypothetical protein
MANQKGTSASYTCRHMTGIQLHSDVTPRRKKKTNFIIITGNYRVYL